MQSERSCPQSRRLGAATTAGHKRFAHDLALTSFCQRPHRGTSGQHFRHGLRSLIRQNRDAGGVTKISLTPRSNAADDNASSEFTGLYHLTSEFRQATEARNYRAYCRLECGLCATFISRLQPAIEFTALKPFFPFIRLASVLEFPRTSENLSLWLELAFCGGFALGQAHPGAVDEILPDHALRQARRSLYTLRNLTGPGTPDARKLGFAFSDLVARQWPRIGPDEIDQIFCDTAIRALRAGFMAATVADTDPCLIEFCGDLASAVVASQGLVRMALIEACTYEWQLNLGKRMEHPLLRCGRQLHRDDARAQLGLLRKLGAILHAAEIRSENEDLATLLQHAPKESPTRWATADAPFRGQLLERLVTYLDRESQFQSSPRATTSSPVACYGF